MLRATFSFPTTSLFGAGRLAELPQQLEGLGIRRPLVVTDPGVLNTEAFQRLDHALGPRRQGKNWFLSFGVHANPLEHDVLEAAAAFRANDCDAVVALGGGSPLDVG